MPSHPIALLQDRPDAALASTLASPERTADLPNRHTVAPTKLMPVASATPTRPELIVWRPRTMREWLS